jgi:SAM-dependent methyltransferase
MSTDDDLAEWYERWVGTHSMREDPFFRAGEALMDEVEGARICDLACGQGRVARQRADLGARVVGIDLSANRTLSTYSNTLADAGLQLVRVSEPHAPSAFADSPSLSGMGRPVWAEVPAVLVVGCRKGTSKQGE